MFRDVDLELHALSETLSGSTGMHIFTTTSLPTNTSWALELWHELHSILVLVGEEAFSRMTFYAQDHGASITISFADGKDVAGVDTLCKEVDNFNAHSLAIKNTCSETPEAHSLTNYYVSYADRWRQALQATIDHTHQHEKLREQRERHWRLVSKASFDEPPSFKAPSPGR